MDIPPLSGANPMGFDEYSSSQDFRRPSPPPVRRPDVIWQMPEPSNPGLRTLWDSADNDSTPPTRENAGPFQSNWNMPSAGPSNENTTERVTSLRVAAHNRVRKSTPSHNLSLEAFTKLTSSDLLNRVRDDADEKAQRRIEELAKAKPKGGGGRRKGSKLIEASGRGSGGISKAGNSMTRTRATRLDRNGKKKSFKSFSDVTDASMDIDHDSSRSFVTSLAQRDTRDTRNTLSSSSSSSLSFPKTPEDSVMVLDTSFSKDDSLMNTDDAPHASSSSLANVLGPTGLGAKQENVSATLSISVSTPRQPEVFTSSMPSGIPSTSKSHSLLIQQGEEKQRPHREKEEPVHSHLQDPPTDTALQPTKSSSGNSHHSASGVRTTSGTSTQPSSALLTSSHPRPSGRPPLLGMRRASTFPATRGGNSSNKGNSGNDLPTRQRGFKPPLLSSSNTNSSQGPNATTLVVDTRSSCTTSSCARKGKMLDIVTKALSSTSTSVTASRSNPPTVLPPVPEIYSSSRKPVKISDPSSDGPEGGEADSSYGDISFDMDALEETMKQFD